MLRRPLVPLELLPGRLAGRTLAAGGRLFLLLVALAGLFAMHGLSDHGAAGQVVTTDAVHAVHPIDADRISVADHPSAAEPATALLRDAVPDPMSHGDHGEGLIGMCLAVLAAAVTLALAAGGRRRPLRLRAGSARSTTPALPARARDPDPPDLRFLSIQRC